MSESKNTVSDTHSSASVNVSLVTDLFKDLQDRICQGLMEIDSQAVVKEDQWDHANGGGGRTRVLERGAIFEKGGVNFSHVKGESLPGSATAGREHVAGKPFQATGVSLVLHPENPFVPTVHMNVRMFVADPEGPAPIWWFGGGYDLTPYYGFVEDCIHWHQNAKDICDQFDTGYYEKYKKWCDDYFYIKHRQEPRGIGGLFFDDLNENSFDHCFQFVQSVGNSFLPGYLPIVEKRKSLHWNDQQKQFQQYRRGRYVEFNLVYDRGTIFGLQSGGRTESILMSLPPKVEWHYQWSSEPESKEALLYEQYLKPRDWLNT